MRLDQLKNDVIDEGRAHPFVETLLGELRLRYQQLHDALEANAANGGPEGPIHALGGRALEVKNLLALITSTKGRDE